MKDVSRFGDCMEERIMKQTKEYKKRRCFVLLSLGGRVELERAGILEGSGPQLS